MKIDLHYQRRRCSPVTLVSGKYKVYADIRRGFLEKGRQPTVGLSKTAIFSTFALYFFRSFRGKANIIIYYYLVHRRLSRDPITRDLKYLAWPFYVKFCFCQFKFKVCSFTYSTAPFYLWRNKTLLCLLGSLIRDSADGDLLPQCPVQLNSLIKY